MAELKTWQKIRQLRAALREWTPEKYAVAALVDKKRVVELRRAERLFTYRYDFAVFCLEVLHGESWGEFPCRWSKVHFALCRFIRNCKNLGVSAFIQLPRHHLKTQIATIFYRIWRAVQDPEVCALIVSGTLKLSKATASAIRRELTGNRELRELYPHVLPDWMANERRNKWSETEFSVARTGNYPQSSIEVVGVEATVTGQHYAEFSLDDLVTPENATTAEQCEKVVRAYKYFLSVANPKRAPGKIPFMVVGTPYTDQDLYTFLRKCGSSRTFRFFIQPVRYNDGSLIWPEMFTEEKLQEIATMQGPYIYSAQYLLEPVPEAQQELRSQWLQYYHALPTDINGREVQLRHIIIVDPITAKPETSTSKDRGVVIVIALTKAPVCYVKEYKLFPRAEESQIFDQVFAFMLKYQTHEVGWETVAYQLQGKINLEQRARREGIRIVVTALKPGHTNKHARIRGVLIPMFEQGKILVRPSMTELVYEYQRFPRGETVDILDALHFIPQMVKQTSLFGGLKQFGKQPCPQTPEQMQRPFYR